MDRRETAVADRTFVSTTAGERRVAVRLDEGLELGAVTLRFVGGGPDARR
jgi:hypothetical protein